jgi:hypothetical protein
MSKSSAAWRSNVRFARSVWGPLPSLARARLRELIQSLAVSVSAGDLQFLQGRWYVTHSGLLKIAHRRHCSGIEAVVVEPLSDPRANRWVFKATVYTDPASRGFVGYGDADPSNVSPVVQGAEMRVAETRAVNRALRKAYGIGICSVEELGSCSAPPPPYSGSPRSGGSRSPNGSHSGELRLRDQLCLLVRKHNLNSTLVKAYAADFCGTGVLSGASRDLVESFISHLSALAIENRGALICKLNSYSAQEPQS